MAAATVLVWEVSLATWVCFLETIGPKAGGGTVGSNYMGNVLGLGRQRHCGFCCREISLSKLEIPGSGTVMGGVGSLSLFSSFFSFSNLVFSCIMG